MLHKIYTVRNDRNPEVVFYFLQWTNATNFKATLDKAYNEGETPYYLSEEKLLG